MRIIFLSLLTFLPFLSNADSCIPYKFGFCIKNDREVNITRFPNRTMVKIDIKGLNFPVFALPSDNEYLEVRLPYLEQKNIEYICSTLPNVKELIFTSGSAYKCK
jgi:hypothetical protein